MRVSINFYDKILLSIIFVDLILTCFKPIDFNLPQFDNFAFNVITFLEPFWSEYFFLKSFLRGGGVKKRIFSTPAALFPSEWMFVITF